MNRITIWNFHNKDGTPAPTRSCTGTDARFFAMYGKPSVSITQTNEPCDCEYCELLHDDEHTHALYLCMMLHNENDLLKECNGRFWFLAQQILGEYYEREYLETCAKHSKL